MVETESLHSPRSVRKGDLTMERISTRTTIRRKLTLMGAAIFCGVAFHAPLAAQRASTAWEYCVVESNGYIAQSRNGRRILTYGVLVHLPGGRQMFQKAGVGNTKVAVQMLNKLGNNGWEVVSHASYFGNLTWTLKRRRK
jgi:hypothetical protein